MLLILHGKDDSMMTDTAEPKPFTTFDRNFAMASAPVLYHYCSAQTLLAILETNTIRFSDANSPWADVFERYGPHTTCYNRLVRWRKAGVWDRLLEAVSQAFDGELVMIESSSIRVHQHGATLTRGTQIAAWDVPEGV